MPLFVISFADGLARDEKPRWIAVMFLTRQTTFNVQTCGGGVHGSSSDFNFA